MIRPDTSVAWLEDDDQLREQIMVQCLRELPEVRFLFSAAAAEFWRHLWEHKPRIVVIDVMLSYVAGTRRLSEGVAVSKWLRDGKIPPEIAGTLGLPAELWGLPDRYADQKVPIIFCTGRSKDRLESELCRLTMDLRPYETMWKGEQSETTAVDKTIERIRQRLGLGPVMPIRSTKR
jgi:CheY-like chemotaxis protein